MVSNKTVTPEEVASEIYNHGMPRKPIKVQVPGGQLLSLTKFAEQFATKEELAKAPIYSFVLAPEIAKRLGYPMFQMG